MPLKGTWAKRHVCLGSSVSTRAKLPVAPPKSAPMISLIKRAYLNALHKFGLKFKKNGLLGLTLV